MKLNTTLKNTLVVIGTAALLGACGQAGKTAAPTVEDVKAWRLAHDTTKIHKATTYDVTDLMCNEASKEALDEARRAYAALGAKGDDAVKVLYLCSYTVNASFEALDKETHQSRDYAITNHRVTNEKFGLVRDGDGHKWLGSPRLPKSAG